VPTELTERWILAGGTPVLLRSAEPGADAPAVLHLHGFGISGRYLMPTAQLLADRQRTYVPDLPGFGRSPLAGRPLTIEGLADAAADVLDAVGVERATVLGNSLGCPILGSFALRHPDRIERAVMVSPAGGVHNRPLLRAVGQLVADAPREPVSMAAVAVPDYLQFGVVESLQLFLAMTRFDSFGALMTMDVPLLAVLGTRDPLLAPVERVRYVAGTRGSTTVAVIKGAAHAINYSHPRELALLVDAFVSGREIDPSDMDPDLAPIGLMPTRG
jgi:pimeloyl-ACP methyl ester carboxylesterase